MAWADRARGREPGEVFVRELYHERGSIGGADLSGAEVVMALGGSAILEAHAGLQILAPRASMVCLGMLRPDEGWSIPEAGTVRWLGDAETRMRTIILIFRRGSESPQ